MNDMHCTTATRTNNLRCKLHRVTIDGTFPEGCPLEAPNPASVLLGLKERALDVMLQGDWSEGTRIGLQYDTCQACVNRSLSHPTVQRMRTCDCRIPVPEGRW